MTKGPGPKPRSIDLLEGGKLKLTDASVLECLREVSKKRTAILHEEAALPSGTDPNSLQAKKKNFAESLSLCLAQRFASWLRPTFKGILPYADGTGHESPARAARKMKKLDVNYSHPQIGLGLGLSVKTINFRDRETKRYTKNYTRADNEWRAEATDYHERQPYAVLIGVLFLPMDSVADVINGHSSFAGAMNVFRYRSNRASARDRTELMERMLIGLYDAADKDFDEVKYLPVDSKCPRNHLPSNMLDNKDVVQLIKQEFDRRNAITVPWLNDAESSDAELEGALTDFDEEDIS